MRSLLEAKAMVVAFDLNNIRAAVAWLKLAAADPILQLHIVLYIYVVKEAGMVYLAWGFEKDANQKHYIYIAAADWS
jgi:hypothetical protein